MPSRNGHRPSHAELVAVRHGQSLANVAFLEAEASGGEAVGLGPCDADVALSAAGRRQAAALGQWLREQPPADVAYCSPYLRARETWQIAADGLAPAQRPMPVVVDERLRDREMGQFELLTPVTIRRRFPEEAQRRVEVGELYYRPPGGESLADVALRLRSFLRDVHLTHRTLVIAHDAVVLMLRYITESLSEEELQSVQPVANASVTRWSASTGVMRLVAYNEVHHLHSADRPLATP